MPTEASLTDFVLQQANLFERADYASLISTLALPTRIDVLHRRMMPRTSEEAATILKIFRDNLVVEDYARTEVEIFHKEPAADGSWRSLLRWTNLNTRDGKINVMDACCFFRTDDDGVWRTELIEVVCEGGKNLTTGLPLH